MCDRDNNSSMTSSHDQRKGIWVICDGLLNMLKMNYWGKITSKRVQFSDWKDVIIVGGFCFQYFCKCTTFITTISSQFWYRISLILLMYSCVKRICGWLIVDRKPANDSSEENNLLNVDWIWEKFLMKIINKLSTFSSTKLEISSRSSNKTRNRTLKTHFNNFCILFVTSCFYEWDTRRLKLNTKLQK